MAASRSPSPKLPAWACVSCTGNLPHTPQAPGQHYKYLLKEGPGTSDPRSPMSPTGTFRGQQVHLQGQQGCFATVEAALSTLLRLLSAGFSLLTGSAQVTAPVNPGRDVTYLSLPRIPRVRFSPCISLVGLFGYLYKCNPSALIAILGLGAFLSVSNVML